MRKVNAEKEHTRGHNHKSKISNSLLRPPKDEEQGNLANEKLTEIVRVMDFPQTL